MHMCPTSHFIFEIFSRTKIKHVKRTRKTRKPLNRRPIIEQVPETRLQGQAGQSGPNQHNLAISRREPGTPLWLGLRLGTGFDGVHKLEDVTDALEHFDGAVTGWDSAFEAVNGEFRGGVREMGWGKWEGGVPEERPEPGFEICELDWGEGGDGDCCCGDGLFFPQRVRSRTVGLGRGEKGN